MNQNNKIKIFPSILSSDFSKLGEEIKIIEKGGADGIHCDIMDGHFVPNITYGPMVVEMLNNFTELPLDVHLMINNSDRYIDDFVKAGANYISVHYENNYHIDRLINFIKSKGVKAGVALNPATTIKVLENILPMLDFILIMSVNPGFGGQKFIEYSLTKISELRELIDKSNSNCLIEVDGGVGTENIYEVNKAGADFVVTGASVFKSKEKETIISKLKELSI